MQGKLALIFNHVDTMPNFLLNIHAHFLCRSYSQPNSKKLLFAVDTGEFRVSWLLQMLKIG